MEAVHTSSLWSMITDLVVYAKIVSLAVIFFNNSQELRSDDPIHCGRPFRIWHGWGDLMDFKTAL